jgi:hypothetical protein
LGLSIRRTSLGKKCPELEEDRETIERIKRNTCLPTNMKMKIQGSMPQQLI